MKKLSIRSPASDNAHMIDARATAPSSNRRSVQPLLPLKLSPPPLRSDLLARPNLQATLAEVRLQPVTLVISPAGYGKTTLLSQWAQELARAGTPVGWLTLDEADVDPALFLAYLIRAVQRCDAELGVQAWRILHSAPDINADWPLIAGALCSDIQSRLHSPSYLFIDDMHTVASSATINQILSYLLRALPPSLHLVLASRHELALAPLPRMRASGELLRVGQDEMQLSEDEARILLEQQGVRTSGEELRRLMTYTDGWVLSVQMIARALAQCDEGARAEYLANIEESHRNLFDYLVAEVISSLPAELIEFLRIVSLSEPFDEHLLDEVLGRSGSGALIKQARSRGIPVQALDARGEQMRFHPLWRELLLREARVHMSADEWQSAHRRLAQALEKRALLERALEHYALTEDTLSLARALRDHAWPLIGSPKRGAIRRWLERLPSEMREADPELLHMWGFSLVGAQPEQAGAAIGRAVQLYEEQGRVERQLRALGDMAALLYWQAQPREFVATCREVIRVAHTQQNDPWSRGALLVGATAVLYTRGRYSAALRVGQRAQAHPLNPFWQWLLALISAHMYVLLGRPIETISTVESVLQVPQITVYDRLRQHLLREKAVALFLIGETGEAVDLGQDVSIMLETAYRDGSSGVSAMVLAWMLLMRQQDDEAATHINRARQAFHQLGEAVSLARIQALEVFAQWRQGRLDKPIEAASAVLQRLDAVEGRTPDMRVRLLMVLMLGENGAISQARAALENLLTQMQAHSYGVYRIVALLYLAHLAGRLSDEALRDEALLEGWRAADSEAITYLPGLPDSVLADVVVGGLRSGEGPPVIEVVLRRQLPEQAVSLLQQLLADPKPQVRVQAAALLGDLGAMSAFASLRALTRDRAPEVRQAAESALGRLSYRPPYTLRVRTLGTFATWRGESEVRDREWRSIKARQLLQLLIAERGRMLPREIILDALWPELDVEAGTNNLRVTVSRLSKALEPERPEGAPPSYVVQQGETYGFNVASDCEIDAVELTGLVVEGQRAERLGQPEQAITFYQRAVATYKGIFLPDCLYEDWTVVERERLALLFNDAALRLGTLLLDQGAASEAIGMAWRVLEYDRAQEEAYRLLMRAHLQLGERSTALRLYSRCVTVLREELAVEPLIETTALYEEIRRGG
jgi:ATP/maltotriose-dependent transcriptional regulator MalT/DNA-binding SARP family transcriptional activator